MLLQRDQVQSFDRVKFAQEDLTEVQQNKNLDSPVSVHSGAHDHDPNALDGIPAPALVAPESVKQVGRQYLGLQSRHRNDLMRCSQLSAETGPPICS